MRARWTASRADVLDAGKHRRDGDEVGAEGLRGEPREGSLADAGRPPQDHRMQLAGIEGEPERLAGAEQMGLADDVGQRTRAQAFGQRRVRAVARRLGGVGLEKVLGGHCCRLSVRTRPPL